jgi:hypothetical protein
MRGDSRAAADELDGRVLLFGRDDGDLDQQPRVGELGLDAGAAGQILPAGPCVPGLVHGVAVANIRRGHRLR